MRETKKNVTEQILRNLAKGVNTVIFFAQCTPSSNYIFFLNVLFYVVLVSPVTYRQPHAHTR